LSPGEQPIMNLPGGIQTYGKPSFGFTFFEPAMRLLGRATEVAAAALGVATNSATHRKLKEGKLNEKLPATGTSE
jgi:hypothetical protein